MSKQQKTHQNFYVLLSCRADKTEEEEEEEEVVAGGRDAECG